MDKYNKIFLDKIWIINFLLYLCTMINEIKDNINLVTIQKWVLSNGQIFYWIIDNNGNPIDGFSKKYQALDAIKRWNLVRENKSIIIIQ